MGCDTFTSGIPGTGIVVSGALANAGMPISGTGIDREADAPGLIVVPHSDLYTLGSQSVRYRFHLVKPLLNSA